MQNNSDPGAISDGSVKLDSDIVLQEPRMYRVILHNDHYTTMEFVVEVLMKVFHKQPAEATKIMLDVHKRGIGMCGVYTFDIASTKVAHVHYLAKQREFPLKCSLEEA
ncbi:MAG: ATP-dependent Clp protease adaptor ClpS [Deltaproteobacteria bacterium]|nr:ATP-dependent Clp protease adaptor ClpS [Deltaproteobacteria bacterium]